MSNPTPYEPGYEYSGVEPIPGNQLDNDFANLQRTTDETIAALADIRRSDGALNNGVVTSDSLSDDIANQIINEVNDQILVLADQVTQDAAASAQSATDAATSASSAASQATLASQWAAKTDGPVADGEFSAKYWAQQAATVNGLPIFETGSLPVTDLGTDIYVDGDGVYSWAASAYVRTDISKSVIALLKTQSAAAFGVGQSWASFNTTDRVVGSNYTNSTGRPIVVQLAGSATGDGSAVVTIDGVASQRSFWAGTNSGSAIGIQAIVPNGSAYSIGMSGATRSSWREYR